MVAATFNLDAEFLVAAFNVARIGICVVDEEGRFIETNPAFCELTGFAREDLVGKPWTLAAPADIAAQAERFLRAVLSRRAVGLLARSRAVEDPAQGRPPG